MKIYTPLAAASVLTAIAGCEPTASTPAPPETGQRILMEKERIARQNAENAMRREESRKWFWQSLAFLLASAAVIALVAGTAIGSKARRDHERRE